MFSYAPNKTNIDEANKHLQLLTERVVELEAQLKEKEEAAAKKEVEMKVYVNTVVQNSQKEIAALSDKLFKAQQSVRKFEAALEERDEETRLMREKCNLLDELVKFKPSLAKLTISLEQAETFNNYAINKMPYVQQRRTESSATANGSAMSEMSPSVTERLAKAMVERDRVRAEANSEFYM